LSVSLCQQATIKNNFALREEKDLIILTKICANQQQLLMLLLLFELAISIAEDNQFNQNKRAKNI